MINLLVVDDQSSVRQGLRMRLSLEPDFSVVGEAGDGEEALAASARLHPDVILMDIEMPRMDGISATAALRTVAPDSAVVVLSLYGDPATRARAREAGAIAFVEKADCQDTLLATIRRVAGHS